VTHIFEAPTVLFLEACNDGTFTVESGILPFYMYTGNNRNMLSDDNYVIFIMLQQNAVIKEEDDVSNDCIDMKFEEVYVPSAFPIEKVEPEVSLIHKCVHACYSCVCPCTRHS
jgi:hypothetical protein